MNHSNNQIAGTAVLKLAAYIEKSLLENIRQTMPKATHLEERVLAIHNVARVMTHNDRIAEFKRLGLK